MKKVSKRILALLLAALMALVIAGCGSSSTETPSSNQPGSNQPSGTQSDTAKPSIAENTNTAENTTKDAGDRDLSLLTIASYTEPASLDLQSISVGGNRAIAHAIMSTLFKMSDDGKSLEPLAAKSYEWVDDLTLKINLRDDVTSSTGEKFTANDVMFVLRRGAACAALGNKYVYFDIDNSYAEDDYTVILKLPKPFANAPYLLTIGCFLMYTQKDFEAVGEENFAHAPIGIGPYVLDEWNLGSDIVCSRRNDWWGDELGTYEKIHWIFITDSNSRSLAIQSGDVDVAEQLSYAIAGSATSANSNIQSWFKSSLYSVAYWFNCDKKEFSDARVRKALNLAVDKDALAKNLTDGTGKGSTGFFHSESPNYVQRGPSYDPAAAKALLEEAGYPNGFEFTLLIRNDDQTYTDTATILQAMYEQVGVTMKIETVDRGVFFPRLTSGDFDAYLINCSGYVPDDILSFFIGANIHGNGNNGNYVNAKFDELYEASMCEFDDAKRAEIYRQIDELFYDDCPICNLFEKEQQYLSVNGIRMYEGDSIGNGQWSHVRFAQ